MLVVGRMRGVILGDVDDNMVVGKVACHSHKVHSRGVARQRHCCEGWQSMCRVLGDVDDHMVVGKVACHSHKVHSRDVARQWYCCEGW